LALTDNLAMPPMSYYSHLAVKNLTEAFRYPKFSLPSRRLKPIINTMILRPHECYLIPSNVFSGVHKRTDGWTDGRTDVGIYSVLLKRHNIF